MSLNPYSTGSWVAGIRCYRYLIHSVCLNPYSTGSWVAGHLKNPKGFQLNCLNPYSTGSWVAGTTKSCKSQKLQVLILILLEVGLLEQQNHAKVRNYKS